MATLALVSTTAPAGLKPAAVSFSGVRRHPPNSLLGDFLILFYHAIGQVRQVRLLGKLTDAVVGQVCAVLRERASIQEGEDWSPKFLEYFFPSRNRSNDVKANVHVWL